MSELDDSDLPALSHARSVTVEAGSLSHGFYDALAGRPASRDDEEYRRGHAVGQANLGEPVEYTVVTPESRGVAIAMDASLVEQLRHACSVAFGDLLAQGMPPGVSTGRLLRAAIVAAEAYLARVEGEACRRG